MKKESRVRKATFQEHKEFSRLHIMIFSLYCKGSAAKCAGWISSLPARSAMVRATVSRVEANFFMIISQGQENEIAPIAGAIKKQTRDPKLGHVFVDLTYRID
jgi:hypothetical protein